MNKQAATAKAKGLFYGWWIVLASSTLYAYGTGTFYYGFSVFFKPIVEDFGWSRAVTAGASSLSRLEGGIEGPITGWLIDRIGPRKVIIGGVVLAGTGFIALHLVNSVLAFYLIYGFLLSLGYNVGFNTPHYAAVSNWFIRKRSRAISIFAVGGGLGGTLVLPAVAWLVATNGWRTAALAIGIGMWVIGIPLAFVVRHRPENYGLLPDGETPPPEAGASLAKRAEAALATDFTAREALRTSSFWLLAGSYTLRSFVTGAVVVHEVSYLTDLGVDALVAASALSAMTLFSIPGRLLFGWLGDYYSKTRLLAVTCVGQAIGVLVFAHALRLETWVFGVPVEIVVFVVVYGLSYGASIPLSPALRADFFGRKAYATITGLTSPISMVGTIAGPVFAGFVYDTTRSYYIAFVVFAATFLLAAVGFTLLKAPRKKVPAVQLA